MQKTLKVFIVCVLLAMGTAIASADDGTMEGAYPSGDSTGKKAGMLLQLGPETYLITPFESVSISLTNVWPDNRHRAFYHPSGSGHVNGFLLFDVSQIPDNATIVSMTLRVYLENDYGSPSNNPVVDVYYSDDDGWTRNTVVPNQLSLDALLANDIPFTSYIPFYDFELDVSAHDWRQDLIDNQISIGFKNDVLYDSYVYFFGAYGIPVGPSPELTIVAEISPINSLTISPPSGDYVTTQGFDLTLIVEAPSLSVIGGSATLDGSDVMSALVSCVVPGTLVSGGQTFRCPGLTGGVFGTGTHTLDITLDLSDGSSVSDSVNWDVKENTEP
jgi:hypothetical protein